MAHKAPSHPDLTAIPILKHESLYVGIDVGKQKHVAGFVSFTLLERHGRFEGCPALSFEQSREGFRSLIDRIRHYVPLEQAYVLLEHTGHYHRALVQYLQELDITVYTMPVQKRPVGMLKTDKRDALGLANHLYNQLEKGIQLSDKTHLVRCLHPPTEAARQLKGWIRHRYELSQECIQRKNKLIAICDEVFPEMSQVLKDPNLPTVLAIREKFPTAHAIATTPLSSLIALRAKSRPRLAQLVQLQQLARESIGITDVVRLRGLLLEQDQLIKELRLLQEHMHQLDSAISTIVEDCREGKILTSMGIGVIQSATLIATIGNILNFETAAELKSYLGWAPKTGQSGTSLDQVKLAHSGTRTTKQMLFLIVGSLINRDTEWAKLHARLVPRKCIYDEKRQTYRGKTRVIVRIAGQLIEMIYALLKQDVEMLSRILPGETLPEPILYDSELHRRHRNGEYRPIKNLPRQRKVIRLPERKR